MALNSFFEWIYSQNMNFSVTYCDCTKLSDSGTPDITQTDVMKKIFLSSRSELRVSLTHIWFFIFFANSTPLSVTLTRLSISTSVWYLNACSMCTISVLNPERVNISQCIFGNVNMIWLWSEPISRRDGNATRGFICTGKQHSCVWTHRTSFVSPHPHLTASFTGQCLIIGEQCLCYASTGSLNLDFHYLPIVALFVTTLSVVLQKTHWSIFW